MPQGIQVVGPDGNTYQFPEGTDKAAAVAYFKRKGIGAAPATAPEPPAPKWYERGGSVGQVFAPPNPVEALAGPLALPLRLAKKGFQAIQKPINKQEELITLLEERGLLKPRAIQHYPAQFLRSTARLGEGFSEPSSALLAAAQLHPLGRLATGGYMLLSGGKSALTPRGEDEPLADYLERILLGSSAMAAGGASAKSGGLRTPKQLLEQRLNRATYASGGAPGVNEAFRATIDDLDQTIRSQRLPVKTVVDVEKAVDSTLNRFNNHFELAMQPYAGDQIVPMNIANDLRAAADKLPPTAQAEAKYIRDYATKFQRPWSLRDLQKEWIYRNKLWRGMAGKTELGQLAAKANATTAITDVVRGSARDAVVDYLESKYPGQGFRDLKLRQSQLLTLKDQLETHTSKLRGQQASRAGGPAREMAHARGVVSRHGIRAYLSLPEQLRRGPETVANIAAKKAFKKLGPGRPLKPLTRAAGGGLGGPQVIPPAGRQPASAGRGMPRHHPPTIEAEESDIEQARRRAPGGLTKAGPSYIRPSARSGYGTGPGAENEPNLDRLKAQLKIAQAGKTESHKGWATRVMNRIEQAKAGGTDTDHFRAALAEIAPGRQFHDLDPATMSKVIQRAQQMKEGR